MNTKTENSLLTLCIMHKSSIHSNFKEKFLCQTNFNFFIKRGNNGKLLSSLLSQQFLVLNNGGPCIFIIFCLRKKAN